MDDLLLPTDGRESTDRLLPYARDDAERRDAHVHALYVVDDRGFFALDDETADSAAASLEAGGTRATDRVADALEPDGIEVTTALRRGDPATEIVDYVETAGVDRVVMGTRGDDYSETMLGSTAERVVSQSPVPVLAVPVSSTTG